MTKAERKVIYIALLEFMQNDPMDVEIFPNLSFGLCYILREVICPRLGIIYDLSFIEDELPELFEEQPFDAKAKNLSYWWKTGEMLPRINAVKNALEKLEREKEKL